MAFNFEYPYVDPNRHNDDWFLKKVKELLATWKEYKDKIDDFVANFLGDISQYVSSILNEWLNDGTLEKYIGIRQYSDNAKLTLVGASIPDQTSQADYSFQSACVGNNKIYFLYNNSDDTNIGIYEYDAISGSLLNSYLTNSLGHGSDCVFYNGLMYVCSNTNVLYTWNNGAIGSHVMNHINSGCTVVGDYLVIYGAGKLYWYNSDLDLVKEVNLDYFATPRNNIAVQTINYDGNAILITCYDTVDRNSYIVPVTLGGSFYKNISIQLNTELECTLLYGGKLYALANNFRSCTIYSCDLYLTNEVNSSEKTFFSSRVLYCRSDANNIWWNGKTSSTPIAKVQNIYNISNEKTSNITVNLLSDYSNDLVFRDLQAILNINGNDFTIGGLAFLNCTRVSINRINCTGSQYYNNNAFYIENTDCSLSNSVINTTSSNDTGIGILYSHAVLNNVTITGNQSGTAINAFQSLLRTNNITNNTSGAIYSNTPIIVDSYDVDLLKNGLNKISNNLQTNTINFNDVNASSNIIVAAGGTITNFPNTVSAPFFLKVNSYSNAKYAQLYASNGDVHYYNNGTWS